MFEPFQNRKPHFFGTVSLSWIVMKSILKTYTFSFFWTKPLRKKIWGLNLYFWKIYFQFLRLNWVFRTNKESNAAVTLHLHLHFWGCCGPKLLVFKRCVHLLIKNLKLFNRALLMNVKFIFLNILKTTNDRVRESVKHALWFALGKSLGKLQTLPRDSMRTLGTSLGKFFPDNFCSFSTVCPKLLPSCPKK